uniref:Uncharacterized protein n=1 Tax=Parascaris univalens TaxID=6257 RepID=A0A915B8X5_PARUN
MALFMSETLIVSLIHQTSLSAKRFSGISACAAKSSLGIHLFIWCLQCFGRNFPHCVVFALFL